MLTAHDDGTVRLWDMSQEICHDGQGREVEEGGADDTFRSEKCVRIIQATNGEKDSGRIEKCLPLSAFRRATPDPTLPVGPSTFLTPPFVNVSRKGS